jgi:hypothetical protein
VRCVVASFGRNGLEPGRLSGERHDARHGYTVGASDIGSISVSDNTNGLITFQVSLVPGSAQIAQDSISIYIDSDQNPTTGDTGGAGADYDLSCDGTTNSIGLYKWDGSSSYTFVDTKSLTGSLIANLDWIE